MPKTANWPAATYAAKTEEALHEAATYVELAFVTLQEIVDRYEKQGLVPDPVPDFETIGHLASLQYGVYEQGRHLTFMGERLAKLVRTIDQIRAEVAADAADSEATEDTE